MAKVEISKEQYDAVIFDLDGVVTKTASVHAEAWKEMFDQFLESYSAKNQQPFIPFDSTHDYIQFVDGKPRYDGIVSFLKSRGIDVPWGGPEDPPTAETVCGMANKKNQMFNDVLREQGVEVYPSTVDLIKNLRNEGIKTAIISSSKNCKPILERVGLLDVFDIKVDGMDAMERGIKGKPAPDVFLTAADDLQIDPKKAVVVEDAISGVQAGRDGGFSLVIGVDRTGHGDELKKHGATVVVKDLDEVSLKASSKKKNALKAFNEIKEMAKDKQIAIFLDYDGTMTPIVSHPELAILSDNMRNTLKRLAKFYTVAIISGRDRPDVEKHVNVKGMFIAGSHGFDIAGPNDYHYENEEGIEFLPVLKNAEKELNEKIEWIEGAWVERKKYSLAAHYRQTPEEFVHEVEKAVDEVHQNHPELRKALGKKIFELQPNIDWNKGKALHWLLNLFNLDRSDVLPVYLGDDVTDEDAFNALTEHGLGIAVQDKPVPTAAKYVLKDPGEVEELLKMFIRGSGE